jgi:hypothetical protein
MLKLGSASDLLYHLLNVVVVPEAVFDIVYVTDMLSVDSPSSLYILHEYAILPPVLFVSP